MRAEEEQERIELYYRQAVAWAPSDEEELAIAQELLEKARRGFVVDDAGDRLIYAADPDLPVDAEFLVDEGALRQQRLRRALPVVGALSVALLAILLLYGGDTTPAPAPTPTPTPTATQVSLFLATQTLTPTATDDPTSTPTPTATATPTPTPTLTPTPLPPEEIEVKPQPVQLEEGAVVPVSLEITGRYFPVVPTGLSDGQWAYLPEADRASWLAGSYVNIILGLPFTAENADLLATLALSDTLTLRNNVAGVNAYRLVERRLVDVYAIEALRQRRAGLTLVLLGGHDESPDRRLVLWAVSIKAGEEVSQP